jgi:hypothetical protein
MLTQERAHCCFRAATFEVEAFAIDIDIERAASRPRGLETFKTLCTKLPLNLTKQRNAHELRQQNCLSSRRFWCTRNALIIRIRYTEQRQYRSFRSMHPV